MRLPQLTEGVLQTLPATAPKMPGSPADLRIYKDHRTPVGIGPGDPGAAELIWRMMVLIRLHGEWAAINLPSMAADLLIEQSRPDKDKRIVNSHFSRNLDGPAVYQFGPEIILRRFADAIKVLIDWKLIGCDQARQVAWLTPRVFDRCQVPLTYPDHLLLKI